MKSYMSFDRQTVRNGPGPGSRNARNWRMGLGGGGEGVGGGGACSGGGGKRPGDELGAAAQALLGTVFL